VAYELWVSGTRGVPMRGFDAPEILTVLSATAFVVASFIYLF